MPLLWVFMIMFDGKKHRRCLAGGHVTKQVEQGLCSDIVDLENVRLAFLIPAVTGLIVVAADVGSAYVMALAVEKVYAVLGPQFGDPEGQKEIIVKALYGPGLSGASRHMGLNETLQDTKA